MKRSNESKGYVRKSKKSRQFIVRDMKASDDNGVDESDNNISDSANKTPRKWLMDEDDRLSVAVKTFGESDWKINSEYVGTRDNVQCRQRWQKVLKPGLQKGKWSGEEDMLLRRLLSQLGFDNWVGIAANIPGRSSKQCRERWNHHLSPTVNTDNMTVEEDEKLLSLHVKYGNSWSKIAREMPGRTDNMVRSRIQVIRRCRVDDTPPSPVGTLVTQSPKQVDNPVSTSVETVIVSQNDKIEEQPLSGSCLEPLFDEKKYEELINERLQFQQLLMIQMEMISDDSKYKVEDFQNGSTGIIDMLQSSERDNSSVVQKPMDIRSLCLILTDKNLEIDAPLATPRFDYPIRHEDICVNTVSVREDYNGYYRGFAGGYNTSRNLYYMDEWSYKLNNPDKLRYPNVSGHGRRAECFVPNIFMDQTLRPGMMTYYNDSNCIFNEWSHDIMYPYNRSATLYGDYTRNRMK